VKKQVTFWAIFIFLILVPLIPGGITASCSRRYPLENFFIAYGVGFFAIPIALGLVAIMTKFIMRIICGPASKMEKNAIVTESDDIEIIKDIHRGLLGMEKRVESLETLMMDRMGAPLSDSYKE
jgi:hypothetical protein